MKTTHVILISTLLVLTGFIKYPDTGYSSDEVIPLVTLSGSEIDPLNSFYYQESETGIEYWMTDTKNFILTKTNSIKKSFTGSPSLKVDKIKMSRLSEIESDIEYWMTDLKSFKSFNLLQSDISDLKVPSPEVRDIQNDSYEMASEIEYWMTDLSSFHHINQCQSVYAKSGQSCLLQPVPESIDDFKEPEVAIESWMISMSEWSIILYTNF